MHMIEVSLQVGLFQLTTIPTSTEIFVPFMEYPLRSAIAALASSSVDMCWNDKKNMYTDQLHDRELILPQNLHYIRSSAT